jgi:dephospho-CoA kinase
VALYGLPVVGLLGGVASGKSLVARLLAEQGACVLDGDTAGHAVLRLPEVVQAIAQRWGRDVLDADGQVRREALAAIVFAPPPDGPRELRHLEELTHPRIERRLKDEAAAAARTGRVRALVLDAAVMLKSGWHAVCDAIVLVDVPRELRQQRAAERGWDAAQFAAREAAQEPIEEKRRFATHTIDNSGPPDATRAQVQAFWNSFVR